MFFALFGTTPQSVALLPPAKVMLTQVLVGETDLSKAADQGRFWSMPQFRPAPFSGTYTSVLLTHELTLRVGRSFCANVNFES